jgi:autotransporter translocation and assembly factor TamB
VDPVVDAEAFTRLIPTQVAAEEKPSQHTITVRVQGRSSRPSVEFIDDPGPNGQAMDQAQILQELTVGRFGQGQQLGDAADSYLTRAISRQLSTELSRAFRGYISEWEIARESSGAPGGGNLMVRVGSQVNDRLALRYGQSLPGTGRANAPTTGSTTTLIERDIEAEYRINRFFYITSQITQKRPVTGIPANSSGPDFNVNLKARWEY